MKDIIEWANSFEVNKREWLLLGKGPSFSRIASIDTRTYFICTLNHVVRELSATLAHFIDIDVVSDCAEAIYKNAEYLLLPYRPHVKNRPTNKTIHDFVAEISVLRKLNDEGRLVWYNLSSSKEAVGTSPVIQATYFSAEAALNVLGICGAKTVRSLGVDGGRSYCQSFNDLRDSTLLANGQPSFDKQFAGIADTIRKVGVFYSPLYRDAPIKVFVGADAAQMAGVKVLEYSIKKYASTSVEVIPIDYEDIPVPILPENRSRTGFSFSRFQIPELCGYSGKAIYLDADMQVFSDISALWDTDFGDADVLYAEQPAAKGRSSQFSVMLLNCANLNWDVREIVRALDNKKYSYDQLMQKLCIVPEMKRRPGLPYEWNSIEYYRPGKTCLIHYTDMLTQPWVTRRNKNGWLWYKNLREALEEGFIQPEFVYSEINKRNVSPDLARWVGLPDPPGLAKMKIKWIPPYFRFINRRPLCLAAILQMSLCTIGSNLLARVASRLRRVIRKFR